MFSRKLALFDEWNSLAVYVSMDNTVVIEDISKWNIIFLVTVSDLTPFSWTYLNMNKILWANPTCSQAKKRNKGNANLGFGCPELKLAQNDVGHFGGQLTLQFGRRWEFGLCYLDSHLRNGMQLQYVKIHRIVFNTEFVRQKRNQGQILEKHVARLNFLL